MSTYSNTIAGITTESHDRLETLEAKLRSLMVAIDWMQPENNRRKNIGLRVAYNFVRDQLGEMEDDAVGLNRPTQSPRMYSFVPRKDVEQFNLPEIQAMLGNMEEAKQYVRVHAALLGFPKRTPKRARNYGMSYTNPLGIFGGSRP